MVEPLMKARAIAVAMVIAVMGAQPAAAQESTLQFTFDDLLPGHPSEETLTFVTDRDVALDEFSWTARQGLLADATLTVELCSKVCVDASSPGDTVFAAGTVHVTATATLAADAPQGGAGAATAVIVLVTPEAVEDELPFTGADLAVAMAWAAALASLGWLILVVSRRREEEPN